MSAAGDGDWRAAAEVLEQALEVAPRWAPAWLALGEAREKLAETVRAARAYRAALLLDPDDALGAGPRLARLNAASPPALPRSYVRALFDDYAPRYQRHLTEGLAYRGPELIAEALDGASPGRRFSLALDLGCGDGMMAARIRPRVERLAGVDLSSAMIAKARQRGTYDELHAEDICVFLEARPAASADLVAAADALPYFGDLTRLFGAVACALAPGGLFAFTAEASDSDAYRLHETLRFAHSAAYLEACAAQAGLARLTLLPASSRREKGRDAPGWVGVLECR